MKKICIINCYFQGNIDWTNQAGKVQRSLRAIFYKLWMANISLLSKSDAKILLVIQSLYYKNLFLRKKSSWPCAPLGLAGVEKGDVIQVRAAPESYFLFLSRTTIQTLSMNSVTELKAGKISQQMGFVTRFLNRASQELKPKSNESTNSGTKLKAQKSKASRKVSSLAS